mgnify:FL=1
MKLPIKRPFHRDVVYQIMAVDVTISLEVDAAQYLTPVSNERTADFIEDRKPLGDAEYWHRFQRNDDLHVVMRELIR